MKTQKLIPLLDYVLQMRGMTTSELCTNFPQRFRMLVWKGSQSEMVKDMLAIDAIKSKMYEDYAKFLSQPLKLSMFVVCDENEVPMMSIDDKEKHFRDHYDGGWWNDFVDYKNKYNKAKSNVLFEGWKESQRSKDIVYNDHFEVNLMTLDCGQFMDGGYLDFRLIGNTICQLADVIQGLTLTENAVKTING